MVMFKSLAAIVLVLFALISQARATDGYFDSNGVKIRYVIEGEGQPVVLIHGWMADSSMWGRDKAGNTKLTAGNGLQLIALDCRGHGKSDKPYDPKMYGTEMAEDVIRLLDHLKIKKASLIGYSMGAFIAGKVAATHPERVLSVIYADQAPLIVGTPSSGSDEVEVFAKAVEDGKGLGPYILNVMPEKKMTLQQANVIAKIMFYGKDVKAFAIAGQSLGKLRVKLEDLRKCKAPTLFIYGGNESHYVIDSVTEARKALGRGDVKVIAGGNHMTTLVNPEFTATIVGFLHSVAH